tara:strand:- start:2593 stop:3537 length:945 start_codon:yes stop_codon:yes gene_type:complete
MDLHTHLLEKKIKSEEYWGRVKKRKLDVVAITEHIEEDPKLAFETVSKNKPRNVVLIPGMELNTSIGHVVALSASPSIYKLAPLMKKGVDIKKAIKIAKKNNVLLSIAHPWGFKYDSAYSLLGEKRLTRFVKENDIGVEAFNGMMGHVGSFVYGTDWVRKPLNFLDFLEKNRITRKARLDKIGKKIRKKLDIKSREVAERCTKPIELGGSASFITAGSDAHSASRIGSGILKIKMRKQKLNAEKIIAALRDRSNVVWAGPFVEERKDGSYKIVKERPYRSEIISGLKYATISTGKKGLGNLGSKIKKRIKRVKE